MHWAPVEVHMPATVRLHCTELQRIKLIPLLTPLRLVCLLNFVGR